MIIKQAKLAQALHGESSNILNERQFYMVFANNYLTVTHRNPEKAKSHGPFIVFPANIAYLVEEKEKVHAPQFGTESENDQDFLNGKKKAKK